MNSPESFPEKFFGYLEDRSESDTTVVVTLRRSLMLEPGTDARSFPFVERWAGGTNSRRQAIYLAAGLWALSFRRKPDNSSSPKAKRNNSVSFPKAMRKCQQQDGSKSTEKRFTALLDADSDELRWRLRSAVTLVKSKDIALNWPELLDDLLKWNNPRRPVQTKWARAFWEDTAETAA